MGKRSQRVVRHENRQLCPFPSCSTKEYYEGERDESQDDADVGGPKRVSEQVDLTMVFSGTRKLHPVKAIEGEIEGSIPSRLLISIDTQSLRHGFTDRVKGFVVGI